MTSGSVSLRCWIRSPKRAAWRYSKLIESRSSLDRTCCWISRSSRSMRKRSSPSGSAVRISTVICSGALSHGRESMTARVVATSFVIRPIWASRAASARSRSRSASRDARSARSRARRSSSSRFLRSRSALSSAFFRSAVRALSSATSASWTFFWRSATLPDAAAAALLARFASSSFRSASRR